MKRNVVIAMMFAVTGCYHATVETGLRPTPVTVDKAWAHGWILGLVPPSTLETAQKCPQGVARVETQLSFANQLVGILTSYIYTPMAIKVTCSDGQRVAAAPSALRDSTVAVAQPKPNP
jgi:hypothetical protein